jgi:hypothetical protein
MGMGCATNRLRLAAGTPLLRRVTRNEKLAHKSGIRPIAKRGIMFREYFDVSASNTVIEARAINTLIVVNRHAALEGYLSQLTLHSSVEWRYSTCLTISSVYVAPHTVVSCNKTFTSVDRFIQNMHATISCPTNWRGPASRLRSRRRAKRVRQLSEALQASPPSAPFTLAEQVLAGRQLGV